MENKNKMETIEMVDQEEEKEPVFFSPKRVSLVSDVASILSWVVLVGFIADFIIQAVSLQGQMKSQNLVLSTLMREPSFFSYLFINMVNPLLTGLGFFAILQAAAIGLNMLLEMDYNAREAKSKG
jgi:uncharacterized membrane protein YkgB